MYTSTANMFVPLITVCISYIAIVIKLVLEINVYLKNERHRSKDYIRYIPEYALHVSKYNISQTLSCYCLCHSLSLSLVLILFAFPPCPQSLTDHILPVLSPFSPSFLLFIPLLDIFHMTDVAL